MPHVIVGTAGHIDHGKTSLVKALTGVDADRLKEEKERGITIDLGFASLALDDRTTIGFVDVPGHERFVKNMLAGAGGIDAVMLVIAADEAVMPQTREHLDICSLLRVKRGITVLTKIDATDPELVDLAEIEVREYLRGSFLQDAPVLRVSSVTGAGIEALTTELRRFADEIPARDPSLLFRLPVDRSFTMKGFGTVVSGTLAGGRIQRDQEVEVLPPGRIARVRGIQVHGGAVEEAVAGQRTALNLQRVEVDDVQRGMVLVPPGAFRPTTMMDVELQLLASAPAPLLRRKRVRVHIGTAEVMAQAVLLGQEKLEPGGTAFAQLRLEQPAFALPGDRFIVRQYSPMVTIGGGEVLDALPPRHRPKDVSVVGYLRRLAGATVAERVAALVETAGESAMEVSELVARTGLPPERIAAVVASLVTAGSLTRLSDPPLVVASAAACESAAAAMVREVARFHEAQPLLKGMSREDLRSRAAPGASPALFRGVLEHLVASGRLATEQDVVRAPDRVVTLDADEARTRERLAARFREARLQSPATDDVLGELGIERGRARRILQLLVDEGVLVKVADEVFVDRGALTALIADVRARKGVSDRFGVSEFKELTGLSRKHAMPLLEYLDSQRVTRRVGDARLIL